MITNCTLSHTDALHEDLSFLQHICGNF
jgi:hypothetical protein